MNRLQALALALTAMSVLPARAHVADEVLARFAPVVLQRCHGRADYLARFDYDGNWNGSDNWENLERFPLKGYVYASAIETRTHWYLTYAFFHPRDWWPVSLPKVNHENDMEGVRVVVEKGESPRAILLVAIAHSHRLHFSNDPVLAREDLDGPLRTEGERPIVEIKPYKHPARAYIGDAVDREKGVIYRPGPATEPRGDRGTASYELLSMQHTLWAHRGAIGPNGTFGETEIFADGQYGSSFNGDNYDRNSADAPWNWGYDPEHGLARGEWFFDPVKAIRLRFPRHTDRFSAEYRYRPFGPIGPAR